MMTPFAKWRRAVAHAPLKLGTPRVNRGSDGASPSPTYAPVLSRLQFFLLRMMMSRRVDLFSDDNRRNPFPIYDYLRAASPVFHVPPPFDAWMVFDYEGVKRVLSDHEPFSSRGPGPRNWFLFFDPPNHTKLRGLISRAFTSRVVTNLEPRIRE